MSWRGKQAIVCAYWQSVSAIIIVTIMTTDFFQGQWDYIQEIQLENIMIIGGFNEQSLKMQSETMETSVATVQIGDDYLFQGGSNDDGVEQTYLNTVYRLMELRWIGFATVRDGDTWKDYQVSEFMIQHQ